ncbi:MAG TPA: DUF1249 domain-containing protein [Thiotrichaceae bacterium]|nr:DUF1249 domain-containing protein [Thiotrichaceae bacterium]
MLTKELPASDFTPTPHSFARLMDMYESNYIRLRLLCGNIHNLPDHQISHIKGSVPLSITTTERTAHTTTIILTYLFTDSNITLRRPDLVVRIYHDARQAEVISRHCHISNQRLRPWQQKVDSVLLCRWRLNRFLYKWSRYLYRQGHQFKLIKPQQ